jgi:hypothetical protein
MNNSVIKHHRSGFLYNETLATKLKFSGVFGVWEIQERVTKNEEGDSSYWILKDEYGARLSCWNEELIKNLHIAEKYAVEGEIKIGKGGTFLNLKKAEVLSGNNFQEENTHPEKHRYSR